MQLASMQRIVRPNTVDKFGNLQPIVDGLILTTKEISRSDKSSFGLFYIASMYVLYVLVAGWAIVILHILLTLALLV